MTDLERGRDRSKSGLDLDELLQPLGGFGRFQIVNLLHIALIIILAGSTELSYVFTSGALPHRCLIKECESVRNATYDNPCLPSALPVTSTGQFDSCQRYINGSTNVITCDAFVYQTEEWTINREDWDIHCDSDRWMLTLIGSLNNAGEVVGSLYVGFLSDRFGRKSVIITMAIIVSLLGIIQSFSINYVMFAAFEFITTCMEGGLFTMPFVLALEIVDPSKRVLAGTLVTCAYSMGEVLAGLVQWATFDWRTLLRVLRIPFLSIILFHWTMPESVRWLMSKRRHKEAIEVLKKVAQINGTKFTPKMEEACMANNANEHMSDADKKAEVIAVMKSRRLRLRFLAASFVWIANTFIFFGMGLNSVSINDDKFVNFICTCIIEIPAYMSAYLLLDRIGRRLTQSCSLFLSSLGCLLFAFTPPDWNWAQLLLFLIGKYGIAISFVVTDMYTTEMFPTPVRGAAVSTGHMVGRIAAVLAPQTPLLADIYKPLPLLLFCVMGSIGGSLALTLPETINTKLPDTVEEAEALGLASNSNSNNAVGSKT